MDTKAYDRTTLGCLFVAIACAFAYDHLAIGKWVPILIGIAAALVAFSAYFRFHQADEKREEVLVNKNHRAAVVPANERQNVHLRTADIVALVKRSLTVETQLLTRMAALENRQREIEQKTHSAIVHYFMRGDVELLRDERRAVAFLRRQSAGTLESFLPDILSALADDNKSSSPREVEDIGAKTLQ